MSPTDVVPLLVAAAFVVLAGVFACVEVALSRISRVRVDELFRGLRGTTAVSDGRLARAVLAGRLRWVEDGIVDTSEGTGPWIAPRTP